MNDDFYLEGDEPLRTREKLELAKWSFEQLIATGDYESLTNFQNTGVGASWGIIKHDLCLLFNYMLRVSGLWESQISPNELQEIIWGSQLKETQTVNEEQTLER